MKRPLGFALLSLALAFLVLARVDALLEGGPPWYGGWPAVVALNLLYVSLMAVTAEALWRVRPWCTRALAWTSVVAMPLLVAGGGLSGAGRGMRLVFVLCVAAFLATLLLYVDDRADRLFGQPVPPPPARAARRRVSILPQRRP